MSTSKKVFATLGVSVLALAAIAVGSAQTDTNTATDNQVFAHGGQRGGQDDGQKMGRMGRMGQMIQGRMGAKGRQMGGGFGRLMGSEGSTVTATFYSADPAQGGTVLNSYSLVVGQDSERTFATNMREAMETAAFASITTGPQSRTFELPQADAENSNMNNRMNKRNGQQGLKGLNLSHLNDGSTIQVNFYNGDPEQGAAVSSSYSFTQGQSSESAFMEAVQTARESATFVQINTSEQTHTMDLEANRAERGERGNRGFRGQGGENSQDAPQERTN